MTLLLDTCCLLWALQNPKRLSAVARNALSNPANTLVVSPFSFWEISLKTSLGKLHLQGRLPEDLPREVEHAGWSILPLNLQVLASSWRLPRLPIHRDPFDRLLVWQAICESFTMVSRDNLLRIYAPYGLKVCW